MPASQFEQTPDVNTYIETTDAGTAHAGGFHAYEGYPDPEDTSSAAANRTPSVLDTVPSADIDDLPEPVGRAQTADKFYVKWRTPQSKTKERK